MKSVVSSPGEDYDAPHLAKNAANYTALTPLVLLRRAAAVYPDKIAVIHGAARFTYRELYSRCRPPQQDERRQRRVIRCVLRKVRRVVMLAG